MKIVKNDIEFKGEKYKAVIIPYVNYTIIILFKKNKLFSAYETVINPPLNGKNYIEMIKIVFERYNTYVNSKIINTKEYQDLQKWNGVIE